MIQAADIFDYTYENLATFNARVFCSDLSALLDELRVLHMDEGEEKYTTFVLF